MSVNKSSKRSAHASRGADYSPIYAICACDFCVLVSLRSSAFVVSAGVGRTGTFMVVDSMLDRIKAENTLDIYNFVAYLRTRRTAMVQTEVCTAL